jgi:hypothetical protein
MGILLRLISSQDTKTGLPGGTFRAPLLMGLRKFTQWILSTGIRIVNQFAKVVYTSGKIRKKTL